MGKITTAGIVTFGAIAVAVNASSLDVPNISFDSMYDNNHIHVEQRNNVVEATMPWKDQNGIKIEYDMGDPSIIEKIKDKRNKQVIIKKTDDGIKMDIILSEKPETNKFCYKIEGYENYDFEFQAPLTPEQIADGWKRPDEIIGSYAVYHKTLRDHVEGQTDYETGKVMHIPYPYIWEIGKEDQKVRAESFTYHNGNLCLTVPQSFLDNADYANGIEIDPTLGYTKIGGTSSNGTNRIRCTAVIPPVAASITFVTVYGANDAGDHGVGALYSGTTTLLATTTDLGGSLVLDWHQASLNTAQSVNVGTTYYACGHFDLDANSGYSNYYFDSAGIGIGASDNTSNYPTFNSTTTQDVGVQYSIYATYSCDPYSTQCTDVISNVGYTTWTAPTDVTSAKVACWGPGGGGGVISNAGGAGGGGGAFASSSISVVPGTGYTVFIGTGGPADNGASTSDSSFATTTVVADGGQGASATVQSTIGNGGYASASVGTVKFSGGNGGTGLTTDDTGGGGGGGAGPHGAGGTGSNGTATVGGNGGQGDNGNGGNGGGGDVNGSTAPNGGTGIPHTWGGGGGGGGDQASAAGSGAPYGGGGGGSELTGGQGGNGKCEISYVAVAAASITGVSTTNIVNGSVILNGASLIIQ